MKLELKNWKPEVEAAPEMVEVLVQAAYQEALHGELGGISVGVDAASGTLVIAMLEDDGVHVYDCSIRRSNQDAQAMIAEGDATAEDAPAPKHQRYLA